MYDPSLQWAVLELLDQWDALPLSDLLGMLDPTQRPRFRAEVVSDLEWEGFVTVRPVGDEDVLEITPLGKSRLATTDPPACPSSEV